MTQNNVSKIKQERNQTSGVIKDTKKQIEKNAKELGSRKAEHDRNVQTLARNASMMNQAAVELAAIDSVIAVSTDSLTTLEMEYDKLSQAYFGTMRQLQKSGALRNPVIYLLTSPSVDEGVKRFRYMRELKKWREQRMALLAKKRADITAANTRLASLHGQRTESLKKLEAYSDDLKSKVASSESEISRLTAEGGALQDRLASAGKRMKQLDVDLQKVIDADRAKQARREKSASKPTSKSSGTNVKTKQPSAKTNISDSERVLTGSFESNKGRLLFPVAGAYRIVRGFGTNSHPTLKNVTTENSGIDIAVSSNNAEARSVFSGTVSAVFHQEGFGYVVMIRHGAYLTIYANLTSIKVKQGDTVKTGQAIGSIGNDPDGGAHKTLHFEIRKERTKLNPMEWVK
ncbi:MAG: peptidoglycan DD-metalloendopeptidase family protein [Muribaculaceae bacterium]|nr:peptidoglycan DD-metalloendopeptidase family protein [Muribaculaceae bacterium]